jgi:transposase-like protein
MRGQRADEQTRAQWRKLIAEAVQSGRSIRAFCQDRGVTEGQFYAWRRRLTGAGHGAVRSGPEGVVPGATFALVQEAGVHPEPAGVELVWADGRRLRIRPGADAATLRTVLAVLEPERC